MDVVDVVTPPTRRTTELILLVVAVGLSLFAYALVGIGVEGTVPADMALVGGGLTVLAAAAHLAVRRFAAYADPLLLPLATALNGLGLVVIHRLDLAHDRHGGSALATRQLVWTALGVAAAVAVLVIVRDHRMMARWTFTAMAAALVLLLLPALPFIGKDINGAQIWIRLGPLSFQPGELAKIALTIFFAGYLVTARDTLSLVGRQVLWMRLPRGRDLGPIILTWVVCLGVLVVEHDLGTSLLVFGLFVAMLYVATERVSWVVIGLLLLAVGAFAAWRLFAHVQLRVDIWLHPFEADMLDRSYQLIQGLYGMADGGLLGTGLGRGRPSIVPFAESDFIVAAVGEELGLAGYFALLMMYLLLVERGLRIALGVRDGFGKLLAAGSAFSIALGVFITAGGVTRVIPLTGLVMPFLAYGGSSMLSNWMIVGLLLRISDGARRPSEVPRTPSQGVPVVTGAGGAG